MAPTCFRLVLLGLGLVCVEDGAVGSGAVPGMTLAPAVVVALGVPENGTNMRDWDATR
jgi:hypothetical protein